MDAFVPPPISDHVWQDPALNRRFLEGVRGGIPLADEQLRVLLRVAGAAVPQIHRFLDLGCGDGVLGRALLEAHPGAQGVFLDFSNTMLDATRTALGSGAPRHHLVLSDYGVAGWAGAVNALAPFDAVVSGYSIHHQPDDCKQRIYGELYSLLRPGGVFLNLEHVASASTWGERLFDDHFVDALTAYHQRSAEPRTRAKVARDYHNRPDKAANRLASVEAQCLWLREVGFERVDCFFKLFELALFGGVRPSA